MKLIEFKYLPYQRWEGPSIGIRGRIAGHKWSIGIAIPNWLGDLIWKVRRVG